MTQNPQTPREGIADAIGGLSDQTHLLIRQEIDSARREIWSKTKAATPALTLLAVTGVLGLCAVASVYRFTLRLLESKVRGAPAALLAAAGYGAAAAGTATAAFQGLRGLSPPLPAETARQTGAGIAEAAGRER
jgi:hypothetical protein